MTYFYWWAGTLGTFSILWAIVGSCVMALGCLPFAMNWDPSASGHCIDRGLFYVVSSALEVTTDLLLLAAPLPAIWRLRLPFYQKVTVTATLLMGSLYATPPSNQLSRANQARTCAIGIARLVIISKTSHEDPAWDFTYAIMWGAIEVCLGIVSACLACLKPLVTMLLRRISHRSPLPPPWTPDPIVISNSGMCLRRMPSGPLDKYRRPSDFYQELEGGDAEVQMPLPPARCMSAPPCTRSGDVQGHAVPLAPPSSPVLCRPFSSFSS